MTSKVVTVEYLPEFKRDIKQLAKKYPSLKSDISPLIEQLQHGHLPGDEIPHTKPYIIYKERVTNSDLGKSKRSGYRVIYWLKSEGNVLLVTIYAKSIQTNISSKQITEIIKNYLR